MLVPEVQLARELSVEEVAILPATGVSVTDALRSYVEAVQVLSRIVSTDVQTMLLFSI